MAPCRPVFFLLCILPLLAYPQQERVALVLSGGGAKGLAHIGVIKALEEHEIPIDYLTGTSMGGVVGAFYAAGYSPHQIEAIATSAAFQDWVNGRVPSSENYYFSKSWTNPSILSVGLSVTSGVQAVLDTYFANDLGLNFALESLLAQATQKAQNNFDSLFVPFRTTASEIFTQELLSLDQGSLSKAARATMTVPLFYRPIKWDKRYVFDGGIYNNFPVDIARSDFRPDIVIGVNVSSKNFTEYPYDKEEELLPQAVFYGMVSKTDGTLYRRDVFLEPGMANLSAFDFGKAKAIIDSGYVETLKHIDEIKQKVRRRVSALEVAQKRATFLQDTLPLLINSVQVEGLEEDQQKYVIKLLQTQDKALPLSTIREGYYRLVSDNYFTQAIPSIHFDPSQGYSLGLEMKPNNRVNVELGGFAASRGIGYLFVGLEYTQLQRRLNKWNLGLYTGGFYKGLDARLRSYLPSTPHMFFEPFFVYNNWDYLDTEDFIARETAPYILERTDRMAGVNYGIATGKTHQITLEAAYLSNKDRFSNLRLYDAREKLDQLKFQGFKGAVRFSSNTLNRKQYASNGARLDVSFSYFSGTEDYQGGSSSLENGTQHVHDRNWFRIRFDAERYKQLGRLSLGYQFTAEVSDLPMFTNYFGTLLYAGEARVFPESPALFLPDWRAPSYSQLGLHGIWAFNKNADFRLSTFVFNSLDKVVEKNTQIPIRDFEIWRPYYAASGGVVYHSPVGPIGARINFYDTRERKWQFLFHIGYILYNKRSID